ncbi:WD40 repeat-like protein [Zalerion maritima]|uniref:WD40 repeat-like protein n=1 Tax=Zalerion maritima TaxID=339359 RepID=A0AAD5WTW7_9PEZI|nr:WD40 repeat-like protein [Zalerion maritima]
MQSSNQQNFFETDASQAKRLKKDLKSQNQSGNPIQLRSKINAAILDPAAPTSCIYAAASSGWVRRVDVDAEDNQSTTSIYSGPKAPLTSLCLGGAGNSILFAGCWDRSIWSWDVSTRRPLKNYVGHSDFVKAVTCSQLGDKHILISGGADKKIIVWDISTGARLHTLQDTVVAMLAVQDLVVDPAISTKDEVHLVSASSDPHIRRWKVSLESAEKIVEADPDAPGTIRHSILEHETSVYKLVFDNEGGGDDGEVDLWTSSADGTSKCLSRMKGFAAEETLEHGDYVRAVALVGAEWVVTAGRDEDLRVWDRASGKMVLEVEGHFDEVTDLVVLEGGKRVVSVSIDGTVRTWEVDRKGIEEMKKRQDEAREGGGEVKEEEEKKGDMLTAEEEAELAELMGDDD